MADYKKQGSQGCTCGNMPAHDHGMKKDTLSQEHSKGKEVGSSRNEGTDSIDRKAGK